MEQCPAIRLDTAPFCVWTEIELVLNQFAPVIKLIVYMTEKIQCGSYKQFISGNPISNRLRNQNDEVNDMDKRAFKNFITKRSTIWTLSLCMTGALALGGIALVDNAVRPQQPETELNELAYLEKELAEHPEIVNDTIDGTLEEKKSSDTAEVSGTVTPEGEETSAVNAVGENTVDIGEETVDNSSENSNSSGQTDDTAAEPAVTDSVISEQALFDAGIQFSDENSLLWPAAGTILIDYCMDGSVYFPTLNQYKYNPALIIGSESGNQVLASAKGIVESVTVDEETGTTLVLNIGNGYKLTYGQLKELAVAEGDIAEAGSVLGYVSEPTKYYSEEGSNLYFKMTQNENAVDPVLYLEG